MISNSKHPRMPARPHHPRKRKPKLKFKVKYFETQGKPVSMMAIFPPCWRELFGFVLTDRPEAWGGVPDVEWSAPAFSNPGDRSSSRNHLVSESPIYFHPADFAAEVTTTEKPSQVLPFADYLLDHKMESKGSWQYDLFTWSFYQWLLSLPWVITMTRYLL